MWRSRLLVVVAVAGALAVAFGVGRLSRPAHERVVVQDRIVERRVEVAAKAESRRAERVVSRTRITRPDGTKVESSEVRAVEAMIRREASTAVMTVVEAHRPAWKVGALVGIPVQPRFPLSPLLVGATVERRLSGPPAAGLWGLFPIDGRSEHATVGASVTATF
jgi:hypothetical protein